MLDHVTLSVSDLRKSRAFYDHALRPLGIERLYDDGDEVSGYGRGGKAFFWIAHQARPATQAHIAFVAPDEEAVRAFHAAGITHGGRDNGGPGLRPEYHAGYYAAFVIDPDGNNIEAVLRKS